jgi:hydroxymethylpyrimidine/phosphomethylpyrimidine kinase
LTAQNTRGVTAVHELPADIVRAQIAAAVEDIGVDAVKVGMLGAVDTARAVAASLRELVDEATPVVVDPVLVSSSGTMLLDAGAAAVLIDQLLPLASVVTPNLPEARVLLGGGELDDDHELARAVLELGPRSIVLTGGHRAEPADIYCDVEQTVEIAWTWSSSSATHGSGCTHSAVLAAELARGATPLAAARVAAQLASEAVRDGLEDVGAGPGPVDVLALRRRAGGANTPPAAA